MSPVQENLLLKVQNLAKMIRDIFGIYHGLDIQGRTVPTDLRQPLCAELIFCPVTPINSLTQMKPYKEAARIIQLCLNV
jgi:hypothetical protein